MFLLSVILKGVPEAIDDFGTKFERFVGAVCVIIDPADSVKIVLLPKQEPQSGEGV